MSQQTIESTTDPKAYQVMSHPLFTASSNDSLQQVAEMFVEYNISGAPVMDGERAVGVITKTDLTRFERERLMHKEEATNRTVAAEPVEAGEAADARNEEKVLRWMTPAVFSVPPEASLGEVCREMIRNGVHHIFVRDDVTGRLLGVVTSFDLLKVLADLLHRTGR
jgi:CBS domain-containing protein